MADLAFKRIWWPSKGSYLSNIFKPEYAYKRYAYKKRKIRRALTLDLYPDSTVIFLRSSSSFICKSLASTSIKLISSPRLRLRPCKAISYVYHNKKEIKYVDVPITQSVLISKSFCFFQHIYEVNTFYLN